MPLTLSDYLDSSTKREPVTTLGDDTAKIPDFHLGSTIGFRKERSVVGDMQTNQSQGWNFAS